MLPCPSTIRVTALSMVTTASPSVCVRVYCMCVHVLCVRALVLALWQVSHPSAVFAVWPL